MSRMETEALIHEYYRKFNDRDVDNFLNLLAENVVHDVNQGERQLGRDAFAAFMNRMSRCYREQLDQITVMSSADGRHAAAEFFVSGDYLVTDAGLPEAKGQTYHLPGGAFFEVCDGKIARVSNYYNLNQWIAQVD